jgi:acetoin utilization deacetylase AcuC-like enzyme
MSLAVITHAACTKHTMGEFHPESPARLLTIDKQILDSDLKHKIQFIEALAIDRKYLELAHDKNYIDFIFANAPATGTFYLDPDTLMNPFTLNATLHASGAATQAVDLVMNNEKQRVFCATRPPGHHAERDKAMGFCIFNHIAIAALYAQHKYKLKRVAVLDFDVHHGNGTENILTDKQGMLFCSTFQHPFYPFSGHENSPAHIINTPLSANTGGEELREVITNKWLPALHQFEPQLILISAGFDAHAEDEISQFNLYEDDYYWMTQQIVKIADAYANGRIISILEGGYALDALGRSVIAHIRAF